MEKSLGAIFAGQKEAVNRFCHFGINVFSRSPRDFWDFCIK